MEVKSKVNLIEIKNGEIEIVVIGDLKGSITILPLDSSKDFVFNGHNKMCREIEITRLTEKKIGE